MKAGNVKILNLIKKRRIMEFKKASSMFNISNIIGFEAGINKYTYNYTAMRHN